MKAIHVKNPRAPQRSPQPMGVSVNIVQRIQFELHATGYHSFGFTSRICYLPYRLAQDTRHDRGCNYNVYSLPWLCLEVLSVAPPTLPQHLLNATVQLLVRYSCQSAQ